MTPIVEPPLTFSITHAGRGGHVVCECAAGTVALPIEMLGGGSFDVCLRGARLVRADRPERGRALRAMERALLREQLRAWFDATGRVEWTVEG